VRLTRSSVLFFFCCADIGTCQYAHSFQEPLFLEYCVGLEWLLEKEKKYERGETALLSDAFTAPKSLSHFISLLTTLSGTKRGSQAHYYNFQNQQGNTNISEPAVYF